MTRQELLAEYLSEPFEDINFDDWLIYTDDEADDYVKEYIRESVWAYNSQFLLAHTQEGISLEVIQAIQKLCEDGNQALFSLIEDFDYFVRDAVLCDGRGHFISSYDGEEHEIGEIDGTWYYAYRR